MEQSRESQACRGHGTSGRGELCGRRRKTLQGVAGALLSQLEQRHCDVVLSLRESRRGRSVVVELGQRLTRGHPLAGRNEKSQKATAGRWEDCGR
jgi:hypothetical protein